MSRSDMLGEFLDGEQRRVVRDEVTRWISAGEPHAEVLLPGLCVKLHQMHCPDGDVWCLAVVIDDASRPRDIREELTETQQCVADLVVLGLSNRQVAEELGRSPETVKSHLREIYDRLGIASRVELAHLMGRSDQQM